MPLKPLDQKIFFLVDADTKRWIDEQATARALKISTFIRTLIHEARERQQQEAQCQ